ncbi:MAG: histidinol-phosphatase [Gaiellaceae bacterium]
MIVDYHTHLRDSSERLAHSPETIERFVASAVRNGVDEIGFTEHDYYFRQLAEVWELPYQTERCSHDLDVYCDAVLEAKRRGLPVKLGLEVDYVGGRQSRLSALLAGYPWDFLLGSVHWIEGEPIDVKPGLWALEPVDEVWRQYVEALCELARSGAVDVLAHPDLPKIFGQRPEPALLAKLHERAASAIGGAAVAIEISTAGLRKPIGELYPDVGFLQALRRHGVPVTLAADAHVPELAGHAIEAAAALARSVGIETVTVFEGRVARQEPLS